jgi:heme/copper-type cytochrome/quinol oxidase subunit 4
MKDSCKESSHVIIAIILETVTENSNRLGFAALQLYRFMFEPSTSTKSSGKSLYDVILVVFFVYCILVPAILILSNFSVNFSTNLLTHLFPRVLYETEAS